MKNKTKALIWEECRVAGSITLACTVMGILVLASFRFFNSDIKLELGLTSDTLIVCGAPLLILFLLIFNPDYKGALHGGFSERILHLPIPTPVPVTISLITRTLFILLATTLIFATTHLIYGEILSYQFIYGITLLYIIVQFLDWARATLSGLVTTLAFLTVTVFAWLFLADDQATLQQALEPLLQMQSSHILYLAAIIITLGFACYLAALLVHQTRIGKTHGFPEFWLWHLSFDRATTREAKPFNTPLQAQIWLNLRQSRFVLPIVTFVGMFVCAVAMAVFYLIFGRMMFFSDQFSVFSDELIGFARSSWSRIPFIALVAGAFAHGATTWAIGSGDTKGLPGYTYLLPLTTEQYAHARMIANAIVLLPTVLLVTILHFAIGGHTFITETIPEGLSVGLTSPKEITWIFLSGTIVFALFAWTLLAFSRLCVVMCLGGGFTVFLTFLYYNFNDEDRMFNVALAIVVILTCLAAYFRAAKDRLVRPRTILLWFTP